MRRKHREDDETNIDMTPMLDIVFIMLIFFIVTTSFIKESAIDLKRPSNSTPDNPQDDPPQVIVISIDDKSTITLEERIIDPEAVGANIETKLSEDPRSPVLIRVHNEAENEVMLRAVDQARDAGVDPAKITVARWLVGKQ